MNRSTTLAQTAPAGILAAWARPAPPGPSAFRVRPLPGEATASYTTRLATAYLVSLPHLLDGLGIHLGLGPGSANGAAPTAELHLDPAAAARLATHARIPHPHLLRALPHLGPGPHEQSSHAGHTQTGPPTAHWQPLEPAQRPVRACTACTLHRSRGTTTAWIYPPDHSPALCARHQQAATDPRHTAPLDIRALPDLTRIPPHGLTHNDRSRFLQHLADRLELHHLTPATHDPLWTRITTR